MPTGQGASGGLGFDTSSQKSTGRTGSEVQFPSQFVLDTHNTLGGPLTFNDMLNLAPRTHALFGGGDTGQLRPGGGFNLGFGAPTPDTTGTLKQPDLGGAPPPTYNTENTPTTSPGPVHTFADLTGAYSNDPDKLSDLQRFFKAGHLDPNGFTSEQFRVELGRAPQYGFSGRSAGNLSDAYAYIQRQDATTTGSFGGGKGTGVF